MDEAVEPTRPLTRGERRVRRGVLLLAIALVLVVIAGRVLLPTHDRLPAIPNAAWIVQDVALRSGQPSDLDFVNLRDLSRVGAVIDLQGDALQGAVVGSFRMRYLSLRIAPGEAPTASQLAAVIAFIGPTLRAGGAFLVHDEFGLDPAPTVGIMLAMLHGQAPRDAVDQARAATPGLLLSATQLAAIAQLGAALSRPRLGLPGIPTSPDPAPYVAVADLNW
jgi:hypothetical protein